MPLHKEIYGLEILDGQMDLLILSEFQEVGQRRICRYLSFENQGLRVLLLLSVICIELLYELSVPNTIPWLV